MNYKLIKMLSLAALMLPVEAQAQSDTTVVIGETGYLAVKPSKPFSGPANLLICSTNATNNTKTVDLSYRVWRADTVAAMATCYILIGQPGEYTLTFKEAATLAGSSNMKWAEESVVTETQNQSDPEKQRRVYKFVNQTGRVGFERDENYASENYKTAAFAEGEHLYLSIPSNVCDRLAASNGKTNRSDLDFIMWHGLTPADITPTAIRSLKATADSQWYDLFGRRLAAPRKGLLIRNGKKTLFK